MKKIWKLFVTLFISLLVIGQNFAPLSTKAAVESDPGITMTGPATINSVGAVSLQLSLGGSAGKLSEDGSVDVTIPKAIVGDASQLTTGLVIGSPFELGPNPVSEDTLGNYILHLDYQANSIDQTTALQSNFSVNFNSPYFTDNTVVPTKVAFKAALVVNGSTLSSVETSATTKPTQNNLPEFTKYSTLGSVAQIDGSPLYKLDMNNSAYNVNVIILNYSQRDLGNIEVKDTLPEGMSLVDDHGIMSDMVTGDGTPTNHIRIFQVDSWNEKNEPNKAHYVSQDFANSITSDGKSFTINFGNVTHTDAYVITYGMGLDNPASTSDFGIKFNNAEEISNGTVVNSTKVAFTRPDSSYSRVALQKSVSAPTLATNSANLDYILTLKSLDGSLAAGTVVTDPLPANTKLTSQEGNDSFDFVSYDEQSNTVKYSLKNTLQQGETAAVTVPVNFENKNTLLSDKILNKASFIYNETQISSGAVATAFVDSAVLTKSNEEGQALAGATFRLEDDKQNVLQENLITDANGQIKSGLLNPGDYQFVETAPATGYLLDATPIKFTVTPGMTKSVTLSAINKKIELMEIPVSKVWVDEDNKYNSRPDSITINLLQNGQKIQSQKITAAEDWKYTFTNLPKTDSNGKKYTYETSEDKVENYLSSKEGNQFTNTYVKAPVIPEVPTDPKIPVTPEVPVIPIKPIVPKDPETVVPEPSKPEVLVKQADTSARNVVEPTQKKLPQTGEATDKLELLGGLLILLVTGLLGFAMTKKVVQK